jgi:uncharacterized protein (UPF0335 family)
MEYQYRLLEPNDDYKQAVIEKAGITATFTIAEVEAMQERNRKALRETEGNLEIRRAEMVNIEHFHPEVKDMSNETLAAAYLYKEAKDFEVKAVPAIASLQAAIEENDAMIATVMQTLGFEKAVDPIISSPDSNEQTPQQDQQG